MRTRLLSRLNGMGTCARYSLGIHTIQNKTCLAIRTSRIQVLLKTSAIAGLEMPMTGLEPFATVHPGTGAFRTVTPDLLAEAALLIVYESPLRTTVQIRTSGLSTTVVRCCGA